MRFSLQPITEISDQLLEIAVPGDFITHAHNPCLINILRKTFGWEGGAFLILENNIPVGYIACMLIRNRIVSMPHFSYGGILTSRSDRTEIYSKVLPLLYQSLSGRNSSNYHYLIREPYRAGGFTRGDKVTSYVVIDDLKDATLKQLKKAEKVSDNGLKCIAGKLELLNDFYQVYSRNMLRLGSPVLPMTLFENIIEDYKGGEARIFCVYKDKKPVGASFLMSYMGFFENTWFSTLKEYNHLFPAQLLHREMIDFSKQNGGHIYSFGRSTAGSTVHEFKRRWGTEEKVIYWNYDSEIKIDPRKAWIISSLWKRLPIGVANFIGPKVGKIIY